MSVCGNDCTLDDGDPVRFAMQNPYEYYIIYPYVDCCLSFGLHCCCDHVMKAVRCYSAVDYVFMFSVVNNIASRFAPYKGLVGGLDL